MPDLSFEVEKAEVLPFAAVPVIVFKLRVTNREAESPVHNVMLRCQIQMEVTRRRYSPEDQKRLLDLFGEPERWSETLRNMLWTHASTVVPPFTGSTTVDLQVPCTFDFNVAATKYFAGLDDGEVPLALLFSGTVFYEGRDGGLQVTQIPWDKEARFRLPVQVWKEMMDVYYPNSAWLSLRRDVFDRLYRYKVRRGIPTWEQALESLLPEAEAPPSEDAKRVEGKVN
ncbi:MAG TPA: DUF6084 family protein [Blastocatellia bacterium]|jgi:hypothetical protein|nr:DUF6084 family protein [Blastocatellia bacterium]